MRAIGFADLSGLLLVHFSIQPSLSSFPGKSDLPLLFRLLCAYEIAVSVLVVFSRLSVTPSKNPHSALPIREIRAIRTQNPSKSLY